jgi:hypothetical protein
MNGIDGLVACAGNWRGTNPLHDPTSGRPDETPSELSVTPVLGGRFLRLDYTWTYRGSPQEGSLLVGFDPGAREVSGHWIDSRHMGRKVMACFGPAAADGTVSVKGSYAAPSGPDWGWRIDITPRSGDSVKVVHINIDPEGSEYPAVEAAYSRA